MKGRTDYHGEFSRLNSGFIELEMSDGTRFRLSEHPAKPGWLNIMGQWTQGTQGWVSVVPQSGNVIEVEVAKYDG